MKVLYVNATNNNGGASIALLKIVEQMSLKGHEVHVMTDCHSGYLLDELKKSNCTLHLVSCALNIKVASHVKNPLTIANYYRSRILSWIIQYRYLNTLIKKLQPEIIHTNVGPLTTAAKICYIKGIPHVWHIREYQKEFGFRMFPSFGYFKKLLFSTNNYNIAITNGIFNYFGLRDGKDVVIYDGVFSAFELNRQYIASKDPYILFVGRVIEAKGVYDILEPFSKFLTKYPGTKLLIAGDYSKNDNYYIKCVEFARNNNIEGNIFFLGIRKDIYKLMQHAACLIVPSHMEGFGFITVEAMLNYCPVIGRNCYGTREQFDNGLKWTGGEIAYRFNSEEELYNCLCQCFESDNTSMLMRAHEAIKKYTIENNVDKIEKLYKQILGKYD